MIHPDRIGHVVIKVRDLERSRRFYTEVLGLELMKELPEVKMIFLASNRRDHHELALAEIGQPPGVPGRTILGCRISRFGSRTSTTCAPPIASSRSTTSRLASRSTTARRGACIFSIRTAISWSFTSTIRRKRSRK